MIRTIVDQLIINLKKLVDLLVISLNSKKREFFECGAKCVRILMKDMLINYG
ncbi:hypothetical protein VQ7734_04989 [Vibrio quintilis]|uniref:Uncharacterized protein n=1 Tax=Vibrio quintilis TaxID=1117707 RepID=A0A1M7Z2L7_9VIBR|nr:hypothetical protein VQ7734_04989 [Vibrio quintilis]